jgi:hypothetical protein
MPTAMIITATQQLETGLQSSQLARQRVGATISALACRPSIRHIMNRSQSGLFVSR